MAKRRRSRATKRKSKSSLPRAAAVVAFTELEETFFAQGTALESAPTIPAAESFDDLEVAPAARPSFWRRLFSRAHAA